jgi:hypothetical protein
MSRTLCAVFEGLTGRVDLRTAGLAQRPVLPISLLTATHKYGTLVLMKTTLELPDDVFRQAKARAAEQGIPLRQFVTEAVADKLKRPPSKKPWMRMAGGLRHLRKETARIQAIIDREFEVIEPEDRR